MIKPKLIGEAGINWNASYDTLIRLTNMIFDTGFDYVKIQLRTPRLCVPESEWDKPKEWFDGSIITYLQYKERMEIDDDQLNAWMNRYSGRVTASVWDIPSLERLTRYNHIPFIKLPSAMITNHELIKATIDTDIPVIMSTGMSTVEEIDTAMNLFPRGYNISLLHCTSTYPAKGEEINLNVMKFLRNRYGVPVGYSSHDPSPMSSVIAMALGAYAIESHLTLDRAMKGSDHAASLEQKGAELIARERDRIMVIMGDGVKRVYASEESSRRKLRGS